jgi:hypothetical protein
MASQGMAQPGTAPQGATPPQSTMPPERAGRQDAMTTNNNYNFKYNMRADIQNLSTVLSDISMIAKSISPEQSRFTAGQRQGDSYRQASSRVFIHNAFGYGLARDNYFTQTVPMSILRSAPETRQPADTEKQPEPERLQIAFPNRRGREERSGNTDEQNIMDVRTVISGVEYLRNKDSGRDTEVSEQKQIIKEMAEKLDTQEKIIRQISSQPVKLKKEEMKAVADEVMVRIDKELRLERQRRGMF